MFCGQHHQCGGGDECAIVVFGTSPHRPSAKLSMYAVSIGKKGQKWPYDQQLMCFHKIFKKLCLITREIKIRWVQPKKVMLPNFGAEQKGHFQLSVIGEMGYHF